MSGRKVAERTENKVKKKIRNEQVRKRKRWKREGELEGVKRKHREVDGNDGQTDERMESKEISG